MSLDEEKIFEIIKQKMLNLSEDEKRNIFGRFLFILKEIESGKEKRIEAGLGIGSVNIFKKLKKLSPKEERRFAIIKELKHVTAGELADKLGSNRNLESIHLNDILRKGYIGKHQEGKFIVFRILEDSIKIAINEILKKKPEADVLSDAIVLQICTMIGVNDIDIVRQIIAMNK